MSKKKKRRQRLIGNLVLLCLSLIVCLAVGELALHVAGFSRPPFMQVDALTGYSLLPGAEGWFTGEGSAWVSINSAGMRDREHDLEKPAGTVRIAVIGDSYTEARQVDVGKTFWAVAERELASCPFFAGRTPEALNFGVMGFGTYQEYLQLSRAWPYKPDIVLLAFFSGNDLVDNVRALKDDAKKPYLVERNGAWSEDTSFRESAAFKRQNSAVMRGLYAVAQRSRLAQLLYAVYLKASAGPQGEPVPADTGAEPGLNDTIYKSPTEDRLWMEAWMTTQHLFGMIADQSRMHDAGLAVMTVTNSIQVHPDPRARAAFAAKLGVPDLLEPDRQVAAWGKANDIPVLALAEPLGKIAEARRVGLHGFAPGQYAGHWNEEGHREAGEQLAQFLCRNAPDLLGVAGNPPRP